MSLWVKTNRFVKTIFPNYIWDIPNNEKKIYLTFDDGPIPEVTEWTLAQLKKHNAKATFFCIGDNIQKHPEIFQKVIENGHAIGNHTFNHLKGWETSLEDYIENTKKCSETITNCQLNTEHCQLFRPPYGKIKPSQAKALRKLGYKIIMWDIISMDFDQTISPEECLNNVLKNIESGSIIVFHDSVKAWKNLEYVLPKTLVFLNENGFVCEKIN
ncbi:MULTISPECIES: polysaccharide deacetylase family protein [unclassified Flavobacterium]|uniref:polysaccharide deacetylase family protein n=1 Tax=unclassified Flavobacterium TaxID=196869 RepID=UPI000EB030A0|nr:MULTISPECIES: polysaccharide deacetylase family protein [unclassified Flavobacterium]RKS00794.1 peptidoglycan/xylan/chitin deacetylase (PgdA/CDA1 family) [Flavobacterium sp. 102]